MKEKIREILWNFVAGEVTDSEAVQQVLDLFAVVGRSEQFTCSCGIPPAIRLCEGVETCLKCGEELSK
jgi:hypothetical protein